jgi:DMSO/TMAO reductase YedYZ molybdopterin-dependent catalytic subunit
MFMLACQITIQEPYPDLSYLVNSNPAEVDNSDLPITPTGGINITGVSPDVDINQYRLTLNGLVATPLILTYEELLAYPTVTEVVLLICSGFFADNAEWTGVPMSILLDEAGVSPEASEVIFRALDGYSVELPLEVAQREGVFLAHTVNGQVLPPEHGYPVRLVVKGNYGADWIKWVEHIEIR